MNFQSARLNCLFRNGMESFSPEHEVKAALLNEIREKMTRLTHVRDVNRESIRLESPYVEDTLLEQISPFRWNRPCPDCSKRYLLLSDAQRNERNFHGK